MSSITLHPTKGVNPRLMACSQCGKDVGVALLGNREGVYSCSICDAKSLGGKPPGNRCPREGCDGHYVKERNLGKYERVPGDICEECRQKNEECAAAVAAGGVYWHCVDCRSGGALKKSEFADAARMAAGVEPPKPCGVEFNKDDCPVCRGGS